MSVCIIVPRINRNLTWNVLKVFFLVSTSMLEHLIFTQYSHRQTFFKKHLIIPLDYQSLKEN